MNGSELKYLAGVADLARLDIEAAGLTLRAQEGALTAIYAGMYARGSRTIDYDEGPPFEISVSARRFQVLAGAFGLANAIKLTISGPNLQLRSKASRAHLRKWGEVSDAPLMSASISLAARLDVADLTAEIEIASAFVAQSQIRPILTGVRLDFGEALTITAFDGAGLLYQSTINPLAIKGAGQITVPALDFLLGARLIGDGKIIITVPAGEQAVILQGNRAIFRSSVLAGTWPDVDSITRKRGTTTFQVAASAISNLIASTKALGAGPDIRVRPGKGSVIFGSESEAGSFATATSGQIPTNLCYDADLLGTVAKLGSVLTFNVPERPNEPTVIDAGHRRCWMVTRI